MIIRQIIIDPISGNRLTKDIDVRIEEMRPTDSQKSFMEPMLVASCDEHFVTTSPHDKLYAILDGRRTFIPYQCHQSYLTQRLINDGMLHVADINTLQAQVGQPMAIMSDMTGEDLRFFVVASIHGNAIAPL